MTLRMLDSITPANLPAGADAYLGYVGGDWPTFTALQLRFPRAHLLSMAISLEEDATGCDVENGDLTLEQIVPWVRRQLARGVHRPVVYVSASRMGAAYDVLWAADLEADTRLLSAHYDAGKHICGPATCKTPGCPPCDGTQWTDKAAGTGGSLIDESELVADFFAAPAPKRKDPDAMLLPAGKSPVAIPLGTRQLHLVTGEDRKVTIQFHGHASPVIAEMSWGHGSTFVDVPDKVHAAMVEVSGLTGHVALTFEA